MIMGSDGLVLTKLVLPDWFCRIGSDELVLPNWF
jgi:hypothetical protein